MIIGRCHSQRASEYRHWNLRLFGRPLGERSIWIRPGKSPPRQLLPASPESASASQPLRTKLAALRPSEASTAARAKDRLEWARVANHGQKNEQPKRVHT